MSPERARLIDLAERWIADDPDPDTRAELRALIDEGDLDALAERFAAPLAFGTAGLRGLLGAGLSRMNAANVARAAWAVAKDALAKVPDAAQRGIVVGRDGRHKSAELARISAEIIAGLGVRVHWIPEPAPTPVAAFLGVYLEAAAVVVVTASHNPPAYNGFKVYSARGSQIVSPQDADIRALRDGVARVAELPRVPFPEAVRERLVRVIGEPERAAFFEALEAQCLGPAQPPMQVSAVTTSLHGVGHPWLMEMLVRRGHRHIFPVLAQAAPDGAFPTVAFPNPEEKGALDLAFALGRDKYAELIVANDPDADRLAAAVRDEGAEAGYRALSGDELGLLLADWILGEGARRGRLPDKPLVVTTIVSTTALEALAAARGAVYRECLTGFKWILEAAFQGEERGETFVFGFEEALGYCCGRAVRDKDGIGAAAVLMELAAALKARGMTLLDRLDELALELGVTATDQVAVTLAGADGLARIGRVMASLRDNPPAWIGGVAVSRARDLAKPADAEAAGLPAGDVLTYWLAGGARLVMRPSGTEPKLKCYLEARAPVGAAGLPAARADAKVLVGHLAAWVRARIDEIP